MAEVEAAEPETDVCVVKRVRKFEGAVDVPGSEGITIQALAMASKTEGETILNRCASTPVVRRFAEQLAGFGISVSFEDETATVISGEATTPEGEVVAESIETYAALAGLSVGRSVILTGNESFKAEAARILDALNAFDAIIRHGEDGPFPAELGKVAPKPGTYQLGQPDSNVKTALFLSALDQEGVFELQQGLSGEDDLEVLFRRAGASLEKARIEDADGYRITHEGPQTLNKRDHELPGDATGALFILAAAATRPKSEVQVQHAGNDWRTRRLIDLLRRLNLTIAIDKTRSSSGFSTRGLNVKVGDLRRIKISDEYAALFLNEVPTFAIIGACAGGETVIRDVASLREGDVDVLSLMVDGLREMGVRVGEMPDGLVIQGVNTLQGSELDAGGDPRVGMAFTIAGLAADGETRIVNPGPIEETYPGVLSRIHSVAVTGRES
jgi:3-phosphoshikimate 1-carboxyvinyltransferase